jgi:5-methylcytosine-specific restriction endonuclease McrA
VIDHLIPLAVRGADEPANWVTLCRECNRAKWRHFGYGFIRRYRGKALRSSVGVRFHNGYLWPHVNGHIRLERRSDWIEARPG